jgi:hypothetical protein
VLFSHFILLSTHVICAQTADRSVIVKDDDIHGLSVLVFHTQKAEKTIVNDAQQEAGILFSSENVESLWDKVARSIVSSALIQHLSLFDAAYEHYKWAKQLILKEHLAEAQEFLRSSSDLLFHLWQQAIENEESAQTEFPFSSLPHAQAQKDPWFEDNPHISRRARKAMRPFLLSLHHPKRSVLDSIFLKNRATEDRQTFSKAGFETIAKGPRSYVRVAKHAKLRGYLIKAYLDTELKEKFDKESWEWLVRRCEGASKVRNIIQKRKIRHFVVPDKWLYPLPAEPSPPNDGYHVRHLALLLVTDMNLASDEHNYYAWSHDITEAHLDEFFMIISRAKGSSYRPDNVAYTKSKKFAFIDTEYPLQGPDFDNIRKFLSGEMREYWDRLVRSGGP